MTNVHDTCAFADSAMRRFFGGSTSAHVTLGRGTSAGTTLVRGTVVVCGTAGWVVGGVVGVVDVDSTAAVSTDDESFDAPPQATQPIEMKARSAAVRRKITERNVTASGKYLPSD